MITQQELMETIEKILNIRKMQDKKLAAKNMADHYVDVKPDFNKALFYDVCGLNGE